jgi:nitronate monooxygenase
MAQRVWEEYYIPGGKAATVPYALPPMHQRRDMRKVVELCIVSNFVEVYLAREGHRNPVGINFLEKVQMPHLASIFGAMLAGVGYVLMGAGIPLHIPGVLDALAGLRPAHYNLAVTGAGQDTDTAMNFDPADYVQGSLASLDRPKFLAIVSSNTLAATMLRRATGRVDGLVIETPIAGGHNAPPRGKLMLNLNGEPIYGERDQVDIAGLRALGVPFWMAGGYGNARSLRYALDQGAAGVQVGTAFAFTEESGLRPDLKNELIAQAVTNTGVVFTDPLASPTGFPFKVAQLQGSYSDPAVAEARNRICDLGYLREPYAAPDGKIGYRCAAEPVANYVAKGGKIEDTVGRKCLCNALMANIGHEQTRKDGYVEPALVTVGDDLNTVAQFLEPGRVSYKAARVVESLLSLTGSTVDPEPEEKPIYATA